MDLLGISDTRPINSLADHLNNFDVDNINIMKMSSENGFICAKCGQEYKKQGHFRNHLKTKHEWNFFSVPFVESDNNAIKAS